MHESTPLLPKCTGPEPAPPKSRPKSKGKLGTFDGVFLPTSLNVLSILMFLRFGFIIGQMGVAGTVLLLLMSYTINVLTVLSISAISTNGTVKGGGAYYMILRLLGPEFGGAIGVIFFIGQILNSSLNVVGFIEPLVVNFGIQTGDLWPLLPVLPAWTTLYLTVLLAACTSVAIVGPSLVSRTAVFLFVVLTLSTLSIPVLTLFVKPGYPLSPPWDHLQYTGPSWATLMGNMWPHFTAGAAGSVQPKGVPETFRNMFGIFFPATAGIFAGALMSGDLANPSRSIPQGTLFGLLASFGLYLSVIVSLGVSTPRLLLHHDIKIIQSINAYGLVIVLGEVATSLFSVIMGIVGAASMLNAIADDRIIPGLSVFSVANKSPRRRRAAELAAIALTWFLAQVFLFADINEIATFITMAFLMTFLVTNLACFLLRVGAAPNFRPSFRYFSSKTALLGGVASVIAMYIVDGVSATSIISFLVFLIMLIHYLTPPLKFGDISQLLIYHQVRKYLLRLKLNMSVKYWRPQILLLCDDPQTSWNLISFCNHLKKGGLYILGHVVLLGNDPNTTSGVSLEFNTDLFREIQKQKHAWVKLRDMAKIKAFVQIAIGPSLPWGVRNVFLGSGLGGMRPNITVLGFYDFKKHGAEFLAKRLLPTDDCRKEKKVSINQWVQIVEDLVIMQATVAVAANFRDMTLPFYNGLWTKRKLTEISPKTKRYIDLYPIQMSTVCFLEDGKSVLSTNFDTYTLILQLGSILSTVDEWKYNGYVLRIIAFVESQAELDDERKRLETLLESLRIEAEVKIVCFDDGHLDSYNILVRGEQRTPENKQEFDHISKVLESQQWWQNLVDLREAIWDIEDQKRSQQDGCSKTASVAIAATITQKLKSLALGRSPNNVGGMGQLLQKNRRYTLLNLHDQGLSLSLNMRAQGDDLFFKYESTLNSSDESNSDLEGIASKGKPKKLSTRDGQELRRREHSREARPRRNEPPQEAEPSETRAESRSRNPVLDRLKRRPGSRSSDQLSGRSSKANLRPNFLAVKIPESKVRDDDADESDDGHGAPSILFVADGEKPNKDEPAASYFDPRGDSERNRTPSILTNDGIQDQIHSPRFLEPREAEKDVVTYKKLQKELAEFTFNDLPARGQHLILNELMRRHSSKDVTEVIFSTLPAPAIGTHLDDEESLDYTNSLGIWLDGLVPVLLFNSQTVTVTTAL